MSDRIKELALRMGWEEMGADLYGKSMDGCMTIYALEKFAALVVRDCIHEIEHHQIPVGNSAAGEMACEWTYDALKEIRANIKEKFGIK